MKVLVVGHGGREHALAWKIKQSPLVKEVFCAPGNAGIAKIADCVPIDATNIVELADFAQTIGADLTVVGPELPMVLGLADEFDRRGLTAFCPDRHAAELEGSKVFAREFMNRHRIPAPRYEIAGTPEAATEIVERAPFGWPMVIKADGLAGGKGAVVAPDLAAGRAAVQSMVRFGTAGQRLVFEEFLPGDEVSFLVIADGVRMVPLVSVQDHKRLQDGDKGPNTGGMGAVSPATHLTMDLHKQIVQEIVLPTLKGMADEGRRYQGVLYAGIMVTDSGPKVLEFNARFGDPECQAIVTRMKSDLMPLLLGAAQGQLRETRIDWLKDPSACVVVASRGYPDAVETGHKVLGLDALEGMEDVVAFHAATRQEGDSVVTMGGRVLGITANGPTLDAAVDRAYEAVGRITFEGMQYRKDIGRRALARLHNEKP